MPDPVMQIQRKAMAIDRALEASYENAVTLGLPPGVLEDLKAERRTSRRSGPWFPTRTPFPSWWQSWRAPWPPSVGNARN
jgi:hypothetical protein